VLCPRTAGAAGSPRVREAKSGGAHARGSIHRFRRRMSMDVVRQRGMRRRSARALSVDTKRLCELYIRLPRHLSRQAHSPLSPPIGLEHSCRALPGSRRPALGCRAASTHSPIAVSAGTTALSPRPVQCSAAFPSLASSLHSRAVPVA